MQALDRGHADRRWRSHRQVQWAGGHVRKGERDTLILYVEWRQRRAARDGQDNPVLDEASRPKLEWFQRDRPLVTFHYVCHVGQTESLKLRSLQTAAPEWEGTARRGADQGQRRPGRARGRRPRLLQAEGRPRGEHLGGSLPRSCASCSAKRPSRSACRRRRTSQVPRMGSRRLTLQQRVFGGFGGKPADGDPARSSSR